MSASRQTARDSWYQSPTISAQHQARFNMPGEEVETPGVHEAQGSRGDTRGKSRARSQSRSRAMQDLQSEVADLQPRVAHLEEGTSLFYDELEVLKTRNADLEAMVESLREGLALLEGKLATCEDAIGRFPAAAPRQPKVDVPKPNPFSGSRIAKDVDNFLWSLDQYFLAKGVTVESQKVNTAGMYLSDFALVWWRGRSERAAQGGAAIDTWAVFKEEFRKQFYPIYAERDARAKLRRLEQRGDIRSYVKEFSELWMQIPSYPRTEAFHSFYEGLKPWAQQELQRREVTDIDKAIEVAEGLVEYLCWEEPDSPKSGGEDQDRVEEMRPDRFPDPRERGQRWVPRRGKEPEKRWERPVTCFLCSGPHTTKNCPDRMKLNAILNGPDVSDGEEPLRMGSMRLCAMTAKQRGQRAKGLMFVDVVLAGTKMSALVDTGASSLFLADRTARKLGLKVVRKAGSIKTVNSREVSISGLAHGVDVRLGGWSGKETVTVVPMDDYDVVLGLDFLVRIKAMLIPYADYLCILDPRCQRLVPVRKEMGTGAGMLSSIERKVKAPATRASLNPVGEYVTSLLPPSDGHVQASSQSRARAKNRRRRRARGQARQPGPAAGARASGQHRRAVQEPLEAARPGSCGSGAGPSSSHLTSLSASTTAQIWENWNSPPKLAAHYFLPAAQRFQLSSFAAQSHQQAAQPDFEPCRPGQFCRPDFPPSLV